MANAIGFLSQTYEATAGLVGSTLLAAQRYPPCWREVTAEAFIDETARYAAPIQNTRRFAAREVVLGEQRIAAGDALLLVLAAANRDPARFPQPDRFQPGRDSAAHFAFSYGRHHCPGGDIARAITRGMV